MTSLQKGARSRPVRNAPGSAPRFGDGLPKDVSNFASYKEDEGTASGDANGSPLRVDLSKLKVPSLRKYTKVYDIPGVNPASSKEELRSAVTKHWDSMQVSEDSVLQNLMRIRGR